MHNKLKQCYNSAWKMLHLISFSVDSDEERDGLMMVMRGLAECLPCETCREHLTQFLAQNDTPTPKECPAFVLSLHNDVNARTDKKLWTLEQAKKQYAGMASACGAFHSNGEEKKKLPTLLVGVIACCVAALVLFLCLRTCHATGCTAV